MLPEKNPTLDELGQTTVIRQGDQIKINLGIFSENTNLVKKVHELLLSMDKKGELTGEGCVLLSGRCSLPVMATLTHTVAHSFSAVAVFDPKMSGYVVCVTHNPSYAIGDLIKV